MTRRRPRKTAIRPPAPLAKCPTGIPGLDEITGGGLPRGRPTLVCGSSGTGKTLLGMQFLVRGALDHGEPGVFVSFEERERDLEQNVASLGFPLRALRARRLLAIEQVIVSRTEILETGEYNLDGLFLRLDAAIRAVGARRVVLDTIEVLFAALSNLGILRAELLRLFLWLKARGITAVVTGERGEGTLTRHGLEEYVSDCVILLDQRVTDQIATRRLRIVKYRGSSHGTNEYPFLIDDHGFSVLPITAINLDYAVSTERMSTGIAKLDAMIGGKGYYRGSTILISGAAGTGKTSIAASFVDAACRRRERCLYLALEESPDQVARNMRSIGLDLQHWVHRGLLRFRASRPTSFGLETHLSQMFRDIEEFRPVNVVVDPISSIQSAGTELDARAMAMRLIDWLKARGITTVFTSLTHGGSPTEQSEVGISSLIDAWLLLQNLETDGERTRGLSVLKVRGMSHSNQMRELRLGEHGVDLIDIVVGPSGILIGSARMAQAALDRAAREEQREQAQTLKAALARKRAAKDARIAELSAEYEAEAGAVQAAIAQAERRSRAEAASRMQLARERLPGTAPGQHRGRHDGEAT